MSSEDWYIEKKELSSFWSWVIVILFSATIVAFGIVVFCLVRESPRQWDFGALPDIPAQSMYGTHPQPKETAVPRQIPPVPGALQRRAPEVRP